MENEILFITHDGVEIKMGDHYWYFGRLRLMKKIHRRRCIEFIKNMRYVSPVYYSPSVMDIGFDHSFIDSMKDMGRYNPPTQNT